jgi:histone H3/H4
MEEKKYKPPRKHHFFEHHIRKVLLQVCPDRNITHQARTQLNELLIITCKIIINKTENILCYTKKNTINERDLESAIKLIFIGQLAHKSIEEGKKCLNNYLLNKEVKGSKNVKADILIPPSILEKFMRNSTIHRVSQGSPIFLAGVIEYFLAQILDLANNAPNLSSHLNKNNGGVRITIFDLEYGVRTDQEINNFFSNNNINFFEAGIVPFIHPNLKLKDGGNDLKSLKSISKIQEDTASLYVFPKSVFENKIKNYISLIYPEIRFQKNCLSLLHNHIEKSIIDLLKNSNNITLYSGRNKVTSNDIELVLSISEKRIPDFLIQNTIPDNDSITDLNLNDI